MRTPALALVALLALPAACRGPLSTVYLVRHAEKAPDPGDGDPDLDAQGEARAHALADTLADVPLDALYCTDLERTRQTLAPLAAARGLEPKVLPAKDVAALVARLKAAPAGSVSLVAGHSNTLPEILAALGADAPEVQHEDYDDLFVLVLGGERPRLMRLHYGAHHRQ